MKMKIRYGMLSIRLMATGLALLLVLSGCVSPAPEGTSPKFSDSEGTGTAAPVLEAVEFKDALQHNVTVTRSERIIAASGSFAQVWLLAGGNLVGTTKDALEEGLVPESVSSIGGNHAPDLEQILALRPDLVILSAELSGHVKLYDPLSAAGITVAYFSVEQFGDYLHMLDICTDITGNKEAYRQNGTAVQGNIQEVLKNVPAKTGPKVLLLRASSSKVAARNSETMTGNMLKDMGCINIADRDNSLLETLSMEVIIQEDPDFIFVTVMGESEEKAQKALQETLLGNPAWANLKAVQKDQYIMLPKDLFHQKPNNRWAESYQKLWELLYEQ